MLACLIATSSVSDLLRLPAFPIRTAVAPARCAAVVLLIKLLKIRTKMDIMSVKSKLELNEFQKLEINLAVDVVKKVQLV